MDFADGTEFVMRQGAMLALLPIEEWLADLRSQDTLGPILDPTSYLKYLYSGRREPLLEILEAALAFKSAIVRAQEGVKAGNIK